MALTALKLSNWVNEDNLESKGSGYGVNTDGMRSIMAVAGLGVECRDWTSKQVEDQLAAQPGKKKRVQQAVLDSTDKQRKAVHFRV